MHAMQTALAESDARTEVLQKYESTQEDNSIIQADQKDSKADTKPTLQLPSQDAFKESSFKYNAPPAIVETAHLRQRLKLKTSRGHCLMAFAKLTLSRLM